MQHEDLEEGDRPTGEMTPYRPPPERGSGRAPRARRDRPDNVGEFRLPFGHARDHAEAPVTLTRRERERLGDLISGLLAGGMHDRDGAFQRILDKLRA